MKIRYANPVVWQTLLVVFVTTTVRGQSDSASLSTLNEVVITGQYTPQSVKQSVYQVRVISRDQIRKQAASNLQNVLSTQLNIRFSQDVSTGGADITMLGLSGQNVKILIDGVPITGRQGTSNEINVNQIDVNSIERIEIIEGPVSIIYGADALAGVINIITQKNKSRRLALSARIQEETIGREYGLNKGIHNQYLSASAAYKRWYLNGAIGHNLFNGWKDTATGRELVWHKKDQIQGNAVLGYHTDKLNIYYRLDGLDEIITNPANVVGSEPAIDQEYITDRLMQQVQANYICNKHLSFNAQASYSTFSRQVYSTLFYPNGDVRAATAPGLQSIDHFDGFIVRTTAVFKPSTLIAIQPGVDINMEKGDGERIKDGTRQISNYAFFLTADMRPHRLFQLRPGLRFEKNSVYKAPPVTPSLNAKLALSPSTDVRLAYARGFRAPSLRELFFDFFDASHQIEGNPDLEAERSHSFTGSLNWKKQLATKATLGIAVNGFYNNVDNRISYALKAGSNSITSYINIDKYKTRGGTLTGNLTYKNLSASLGFGYTGLYNQYAENNKSLPELQWSPEVNTLIFYAFSQIGLDLNLLYKYTGKLPSYQEVSDNNQTDYRLVKISAYHWADFTINQRICSFLKLSAGVRNLFDVTSINNNAGGNGAHSTNGARPIGYGRSFLLGLFFDIQNR